MFLRSRFSSSLKYIFLIISTCTFTNSRQGGHIIGNTLRKDHNQMLHSFFEIALTTFVLFEISEHSAVWKRWHQTVRDMPLCNEVRS